MAKIQIRQLPEKLKLRNEQNLISTLGVRDDNDGSFMTAME